ncbi:MAG: YbgC/FadM family acyl-CoA thioesterase [Planctomycetota bacterium]
MEIRIYYDDTDSGGVVYHANYLKYFERGRTEYMRQRGVDPKDMVAQGLIFVITHTELSFLSPARYADIITVETFIKDISGASIIFGYKISLAGKEKPLVIGTTKIALVNTEMKVQRLTDEFIARLKSKV